MANIQWIWFKIRAIWKQPRYVSAVKKEAESGSIVWNYMDFGSIHSQLEEELRSISEQGVV